MASVQPEVHFLTDSMGVAAPRNAIIHFFYLPAVPGCCNCQCNCAQMSRLCITQPELELCLQWPTPEEWNSLPPANHLLPEDGPPCQLPAHLSTLAPDEAFFSCYSKACAWLVGWCCCALNF